MATSRDAEGGEKGGRGAEGTEWSAVLGGLCGGGPDGDAFGGGESGGGGGGGGGTVEEGGGEGWKKV